MVICWVVLGALLVTADGLPLYENNNDIYNQPPKYQQESSFIIPGREVRSGIFWTGSRYNRRGSDTGKSLDIKPRADRFFMGSRYGKRAVLSQQPPEVKGVLEGGEALLCKINSFNSFYLCNRLNHGTV